MVSDPIGDLIIQIKNAKNAGKTLLSVPYSKFRNEVGEALKRKGYLGSVQKKGKKVKKTLEICIPSDDKLLEIRDLKRVSRPGRRIYISTREIRLLKAERGTSILSTPKGVLSNDEAEKEKVGGEVLFKIW